MRVEFFCFCQNTRLRTKRRVEVIAEAIQYKQMALMTKICK